MTALQCGESDMISTLNWIVTRWMELPENFDKSMNCVLTHERWAMRNENSIVHYLIGQEETHISKKPLAPKAHGSKQGIKILHFINGSKFFPRES